MKKLTKTSLLLAIFIFIYILPTKVFADSVKIYTSTIPTNNYLYVGSGSRQLNFETDNVYLDYTYLPRYFLITLCSSSERIYDYSINSVNNVPTLDEVSFLNTSYSCTFPTSTGYNGHLIYIVGQYSIGYNCSASMTNCTQKGSLQMNVPNNSSWTLLAYQNSIDSIAIDYATNTIVTQNQSIISGQSAINSSIINMQSSIDAAKNQAHADAQQAHNDAQATQNKIDGVKDAVKDDNVNSTTGKSFFDNFSDNTHGLSGIITAPLNMINGLVNVSSTSCSDLTGTYQNQNFSIPCGKLLWAHSGISQFNDFYNLVVGGALCYWIIRDLFLTIEALKDPDNDKVEVMSL